MTVLIIFVGIIIGLNCIPLMTKKNFPRMEKIIMRILIASIILFLTFLTFEFNGYQLKGLYTFPSIGVCLIISTVLYFVLFKNTIKKIIIVFLITPLIVLSISTLLFGRVLKEFEVNERTKIEVMRGGLLSCGEIIKITQSEFGFFDKEVHYESGLCLTGITKISTLKIHENHAEFWIYHNGQNDSENPYKYDVERKNVW